MVNLGLGPPRGGSTGAGAGGVFAAMIEGLNEFIWIFKASDIQPFSI